MSKNKNKKAPAYPLSHQERWDNSERFQKAVNEYLRRWYEHRYG